MQRTPVSSSSLRSVGYDPRMQTLEAEFVGGGVYQYFGVPEHVFLGLLSAPSHGEYFDQHIKKAGYRFQRVG